MYFPYFITYIVIGFGISLLVFFWALKNGQFKDQQRARFLPLVDGHEKPITKISRFKRYEAYALVLLSLAGLAASGAVLVFALLNTNKF
jgi:cbb3-type cytochrome oxidase maturation protein